MAVKQLLQAWVRLGHRGQVINICRWSIAAVTIGLGVLSLVRQSGLRHSIDSWINIHALFGLMIIGFCLMRLSAHGQLSPLRAPELCQISRELSRMIYLLLYVVIGVRQIISIANHICYGGPMEFNLADEADKGPDITGFDLKDDSQAFFGAGLVALVFIRLLVYGMWLRVADRTVAVYRSTGRSDLRQRQAASRGSR